MSENRTRDVGGAILLVDDQEAVRRTARRLLDRLGYRVLEAEDAVSALEVLAAEKVALLISDVVMPGEMDGVALARAAIELQPGIRVVLTSGYPQGYAGSGEKTLLPNDFQFLSKPYRAEELRRAVQESLGS